MFVRQNDHSMTTMKQSRLKRFRTVGIDIFAFVAIFILVQLVVSLILNSCLDGMRNSSGTLTDYGFCLSYLCYMVPTLILVTRYESVRYKCSTPIKSAWRGFDPTMVLWGFILLVSTSIALSPIKELFPASERALPLGGWTLVAVCVLAPVFEEIIFRGRLFSMLHHSVGALSSAVITALLFGLVHGDPRTMVEGFMAGMIFSYLYIRKGSIIAPILVHACNNAIAYAMIVLSYQNKSVGEILGENVNMTIVYIVSVVVMLVGFAVVIRTLRRYGAERCSSISNEQ